MESFSSACCSVDMLNSSSSSTSSSSSSNSDSSVSVSSNINSNSSSTSSSSSSTSTGNTYQHTENNDAQVDLDLDLDLGLGQRQRLLESSHHSKNSFASIHPPPTVTASLSAYQFHQRALRAAENAFLGSTRTQIGSTGNLIDSELTSAYGWTAVHGLFDESDTSYSISDGGLLYTAVHSTNTCALVPVGFSSPTRVAWEFVLVTDSANDECSVFGAATKLVLIPCQSCTNPVLILY